MSFRNISCFYTKSTSTYLIEGIDILIATEMDECESNPCQNGASCNDLVASYSCSCAAGYTGDDCSIGKVIRSKTLLLAFEIRFFGRLLKYV